MKLWHDTIKTNIGKVGFWAAASCICAEHPGTSVDTEQLALN